MGVSRIPSKQAGGAQIWQEVSLSTVTPASTVVLDTLDVSNFDTIEYSLKITQAVGDKVRFLKLAVVRQSSSAKEVVYARIGSTVNMEVFTEVVGSTYNLKITNNELTDIAVQGAKLVF